MRQEVSELFSSPKILERCDSCERDLDALLPIWELSALPQEYPFHSKEICWPKKVSVFCLWERWKVGEYFIRVIRIVVSILVYIYI